MASRYDDEAFRKAVAAQLGLRRYIPRIYGSSEGETQELGSQDVADALQTLGARTSAEDEGFESPLTVLLDRALEDAAAEARGSEARDPGLHFEHIDYRELQKLAPKGHEADSSSDQEDSETSDRRPATA